MALAGLWAGGVPGLVGIDIADFGRRYMASDRPSAWLMGLVSHLINSVLLTFVWAAVIEPNLSWPRIWEGVFWGVILAVLLAGALIAPIAGLGILGWKTGHPRFAITGFLLHILRGAVIGTVYVPR